MPEVIASDAPSAGRGRHLLFAVMAFAISMLACLLFAELVLRFLPVATGLWAMPVNAANPVFRFTPDREFLYSRDWNFSLVNSGRINNDGFVNDETYAMNDGRPLLAVVGDSYVEAAMVPNAETLYRRLSARLDGNGRIYSFGASGAPLSQYLVWARYAVQKYGARGIAIVVVGNDFDESLWTHNQRPGLHVYVKDPEGRLQLRRTDYRPSPLRSLVRHSALSRYLVFNLQALDAAKAIALRWGLISAAQAAMPKYVGNTAAEASPQRVHESQEAIDAFLDDLGKMVALPPERIAFLVDGARYQHEVEITERSYFGQMRTYFMRQASQRGHEVIDLQPSFLARSRDGSTRFEFPTDGHWNAVGHAVVAEALASSRLFAATFATPMNPQP
jgi:hypothetical protein